MAKTKRKRQTKHRGTQAGTIESRGRTSRPTTRAQARQQITQDRQRKRVDRASQPPSWRSSSIRAGFAAVFLFVLMLLLFKQPVASVVMLCIVALALYIPLGFYFDSFLYNRRLKAMQAAVDSNSNGAPKK